MARPARTILDVRIRFGNAAMQTPADAADALEEIVTRLRQNSDANLTERAPSIDRRILDANGEPVGKWTLRRRRITEGD